VRFSSGAFNGIGFSPGNCAMTQYRNRPVLVSLLVWFSIALAAQSPQTPRGEQETEMTSRPEKSANAAEITSRAVVPTFKSRAELVLVPVVVRDAKGNAVGSLRLEDFRVLDEGKPQIVKYFAIETSETRAVDGKGKALASGDTKLTDTDLSSRTGIPRRFLAYVFDDVHLSAAEIVSVRRATDRQLSALNNLDRVALYMSSHHDMMDFTDDVSKLREILSRLQPQPRITGDQCPWLGPYWADLIDRADYNENDRAVREGLRQIEGCHETMRDPQPPANLAASVPQPEFGPKVMMDLRLSVRRTLEESNRDTRTVLALLRDVVHRMSLLPGERTITLVSPGFLTRQSEEEFAGIIDSATRSKVVINTLDARGVYTVGFDATENLVKESQLRLMVERTAATAQEGILDELAQGTGGLFFHSDNDLNAGFSRTSGRAEYSYVLGFAPQASKARDAYHHLKVTLVDQHDLAVQARRGYMTLASAANPAAAAQKEVEAAMFSGEQFLDLPIKLSTEFFKESDQQCKLTSSVRLDLRRLPLRKVDGRNRDDLFFYAAVFDRNGNYVAGNGQMIEMRLRDENLATYGSGFNVTTDFHVKPGKYMLRVIVQDTEGQLRSSADKAVQIP
jgi:VWFA-related protein